VQVGVHAGLVVITHDDDGAAEMFGEAPDVAARVQDAAQPGEVVITGAVHDVVSGLIAAEPMDALRVEGRDPPLRLYRALSAGPAGGRGFAPRETTPFVGRNEEARLLTSRWERVQDGGGQFVLVVGEPGIGKTRLVREFMAGRPGADHRAIECAGLPLFASTPFHAVTQILRQGLGWPEGDTPAERIAGLERAMVQAGLKADEAVPLVADLLGLPIPPSYAPLMLAPDQRRRRLLAALTAWVLAAARDQPLLLVVEDLHWVDPSSLELLQTLAEQGATARVMLLCTARPEFEARWSGRSHHTRITLAGLAARPMRALVDGLVARAGMPDATADAVVERADGVPLFAEELTRLMLDGEGNRGPAPIEAGYIPATLLDSLAARLDRLGPGKAVAQLGSVLGRTFPYDLLQAVSPIPEEDLQSGLAQLADAELIYVRGLAPEATYQFKHALIQDAAYATLPKARRRELHAGVAQTLAGPFGARAEAQPEVMARHWQEAGEDDKAIAAWTKAAAAAEARHAFVEAEDGYRRALAIVATKPETPARDQHELDLGLALVVVTTTTHGHRALATVDLGARNQVLAERGGFVGAITGMRILAFSQSVMAGDWVQATAQAEQMRDFADGLGPGAERKGWRYACAMSRFTQFNAAYYRGVLPEAEAHFQRWLEFHQGEEFDQRLTTTPALCNAAHLARHLGRADLAQARADQARVWARETGVAYEVAFAQSLDALLQVFLRDVDRAEAVGAEAVTMAEEKGFLHVAGWARAALGWARAQRGATGEGVELIRASIADLGAVQFRVSLPLFMTLLAEAQALDGAVGEAFASFEDALNVNPQERVYRPQTLICRGELRARMGHADLAQADFRDAIALAQSMNAAGYELRAATGLARLLAVRGDGAAGRQVLVPRLAAVADVTETADVADARKLVGELPG
jgi:tetratricopeptide (TPR) repeat protein